MCSCKFKSGNVQALASQGFSTIIPTSQFSSDNTYATFKFYKCVSESKFKNALSTIKIDGNTTLADKVNTDEDIKKLALYADNGSGMQKWGVDLKQLLGSIKFNQSELDNAQCQIAFSND